MADSPLENSLWDDLSMEARFAQENGKLVATIHAAYTALNTATPQVKKSPSVQSAMAILASGAGSAPKIVVTPKKG